MKKFGVGILLIFGVLFNTGAAFAGPYIDMDLKAAQDIQTAVAVAAYNKREALKAYRDDIFNFIAKCDNPNPSLQEVIELSKAFYKMDEIFADATEGMFFIMKFRIGARRARRTFHDVSALRKNALAYFRSIQVDVNAGDFASCKAKFEFAMATIDPHVLHEIKFGKFDGRPASLLDD